MASAPRPWDEADLVAIGHVLRPHGLAGDVIVEVWSDFPGRFEPGREVVLRAAQGPPLQTRIAAARPYQGRFLVRFACASNPDEAEGLRGRDVCVLPGDEPARPEGFVFHWEVAGCRAVSPAGGTLGEVIDLVEVAGRPLLRLRTAAGERDVPFTRPIVVSVDVEARRVVLDPPEGLL